MPVVDGGVALMTFLFRLFFYPGEIPNISG